MLVYLFFSCKSVASLRILARLSQHTDDERHQIYELIVVLILYFTHVDSFKLLHH